jgi:hypothetical protein
MAINVYLSEIKRLAIYMNQFKIKFQDRIDTFFDSASAEKNGELLTDVLDYANADPRTFKKEIKELQFGSVLSSPLPVVLEALAVDTMNWGDFYVDVLKEIFAKAREVKEPKLILGYLMEFGFIEKDLLPFNQKIVDVLMTEVGSEIVEIKIAAINMLVNYILNPSIKNKELIITVLISQLNDPSWKVRCFTYELLKLENILPQGQSLSIKDQLLKLIFGVPSAV